MINKNTAVINTDLQGVILKWLQFTRPIHNIANQDQEILSFLIFYYLDFVRNMSSGKAWKLVFDYDTKMLIKESLNIKDYTLQNSLTRLRNKEVIKNNKVESQYIPNLTYNSKEYTLTYKFNING